MLVFESSLRMTRNLDQPRNMARNTLFSAAWKGRRALLMW